MNKIINSKCICNRGLNIIRCETVMLSPCNHMIHMNCYSKYKTKQCPYCNTRVKKIIHKDDYKKNIHLFQECIDIISVNNFDHMCHIRYDEILFNIPNIVNILYDLSHSKNESCLPKLIEQLFEMNNIKIRVRNIEKIQNKEAKVFIANHTSILDFMIISYLIKAKFLISSEIKNNPIGDHATKIIPMIIVDRGKRTNTVDKMIETLKNGESICLFPEGMMSNPKTIIRFRTGAFNTGYPVYPIILKYKNFIVDMNDFDFILKICSNQNEEIEVIFLDPFYPPFDDKKIEEVRRFMCKEGDMLLSRVSNKGLSDKKNDD